MTERIGLFADLHSNLEAFEACMARAEEVGVTRMVFLGDLVGYNADPAAVLNRIIDLVESKKAIAVLGNHDEAVFKDSRDKMNASANAAIEWTKSQLNNEHVDFLKNLPLIIQEEKNCFVCGNLFIPKAHNSKCCSDECSLENKKARSRYHGKAERKQARLNRPPIIRSCTVCNTQFKAKNHHHFICDNKKCKRVGHLLSTYKSMSGNWGKYLKSLCRKREDEKRSKQFTVDELMQILVKQDYKCALSGVELTCKMEINPDFVGNGKRHLWFC